MLSRTLTAVGSKQCKRLTGPVDGVTFRNRTLLTEGGKSEWDELRNEQGRRRVNDPPRDKFI